MNWFSCEHFNQEWQGCILLIIELLYHIFGILTLFTLKSELYHRQNLLQKKN